MSLGIEVNTKEKQMEGLFGVTKAFTSSKSLIVFFFLILFGALVSFWWTDKPFQLLQWVNPSTTKDEHQKNPATKPTALALNCSSPKANATAKTPLIAFPPSIPPTAHPSPASATCPDYFRWIHEDLRPWAATGITSEMVQRAEVEAAFRLVIVDGVPYIHRYHHVFQTRDIFTIWGILQLLRRHQGRVPDLDLMFNCEDMPVVRTPASGSIPPPPLFRYCKDDSTVDIVFPDWSFWGWPEVNIRSWQTTSRELREESERQPWQHREPYAYWKGNPDVATTRKDLMRCNVSKSRDWKARLFRVDWEEERRRGFKNSNLANQCSYRYKVYVEGRSWSVSEKYVMACGSPTLYVETKFQDFVSRGLRPGQHYWPIPKKGVCRAIKQAVEWGNAHPKQALAMADAASRFIHGNLKMEMVYDYMLHLLTEYSKLLTYKPTKPSDAVELNLEWVACPFEGKVRDYLMASMESKPSWKESCTLPPPFSPHELRELVMEKTNGTQVVERLMHSNSGQRSLAGALWSILFISFLHCINVLLSLL